MKKKILKGIGIIGISLTLFLVGCESEILNKNDKVIYEALESSMTASKNEETMELVQEFKSIVESNNEPYTLIKFIDNNIKDATKEEAAAMIIILEDVQKEYIPKYTEELFIEDNQLELLKLSGTDLFFDEEKIEDIKNIKLKEIVTRISEGKYKLINMEGGFYPVIDYENLKEYNPYLSDEIKSYIEIKSLNSNNPAILDGEIAIIFDEIRIRLTETEEHIHKYPQGLKFEEVLRIYADYLRLYMEGSDNSPIYEYESKGIKEDVLNSYRIMARNDKLITSKIISKYLDIIEENEEKIDDNVLSKVAGLLCEAVAILESIK